MDERATGLVLRTYPLTETSLIVHWLTKEQGRIVTVAKGALRAKSLFRGKIDLFFLCDLSFARSCRSELHALKEVTLVNSHPELRTDIASLHCVSYAAALITQTTEADTPVPELFNLLRGFVDWSADSRTHRSSSNARAPAPLVLAFEIKLLHSLGLAPSPGETRLTPGARRLLQHLAETDWSALHRLKLSPAQFNELSRFLHGFLVYHLGKVPPSRETAIQG